MKSKPVYVPNIRTYKKGNKTQTRDIGYWMILTNNKKGDKIQAVL